MIMLTPSYPAWGFWSQGQVETEPAGSWPAPGPYSPAGPRQLPAVGPAGVPPASDDLSSDARDLFQRHSGTGLEWLAGGRAYWRERREDAAPGQRGRLRGIKRGDVGHSQLSPGSGG